MTTLLVARRMSPELAARVEASVSGRRGQAPSSRRLARVLGRAAATAVAAAVILLVVTAVQSHVRAGREAQRSIASRRARLIAEARAEIAAVGPGDLAALRRTEEALARLGGAYEGDLVATGLRLDDVLARPALYVRGSASTVAQPNVVAASSFKDALLHCLVRPPEARTEKAMLAKVKQAHRRAADLELATSAVRSLGEAEAGQPFFEPGWLDAISSAKDEGSLAALETAFARAPLDRAKRALRAEIVIAVVDEPGAGTTELDGERPHDVRVHVVDRASGTTLLRVRRHVDPVWISPAVRAEYAVGLDSCRVALDVRDAAR